MSKYREETWGVAKVAFHANCWIRLYKHRWFTPNEFEAKFGENPSRIPAEAMEILNPLPFVPVGRRAVVRMIQEKKMVSDIVGALERLFEFEDKIRAHFVYKPGQKDQIEWPRKQEKIVPIGERVRPVEPPAPPPDYNDLSNELTQKAIETTQAKTEEVARKWDKFTRRHIR